jgi:hypothetical protein
MLKLPMAVVPLRAARSEKPPAHPLFGPNLSAQDGKNKLAFIGKAT